MTPHPPGPALRAFPGTGEAGSSDYPSIMMLFRLALRLFVFSSLLGPRLERQADL
jgi:hypothetical protein